ncbi:MAG TPA: ROK family transcriptional regulator [Marmoricola sp.]|nr:ROK family transcriptional regulator [Marmoricola sp.]
MAERTSLERLRDANRRAVLTVLATEGPRSRADLARATGLSRTTVSSLVQELVEAGQAVETAERGRPHKGGSGRPPLLVAAVSAHGAVAGVDVGHHHVRVVLGDRTGAVLAEEVRPLDVDDHGSATLDGITRMLRSLARSTGQDPSALRAIGLCVPAPIDRRSAQIRSGVLPGWRDLAPAGQLEERLGVPVAADNDANLGALAELHHGVAHGVGDFVYLKLAGGVGAGLVLGGRLYRGATGIAGELGHVQVVEHGRACRCGNRGCLETEVALPRLLEHVQPTHEGTLTAERLVELDAAGDPGVRRVLGDAGRTAGRALADLCNSLNPSMLVIGGPLGSATSLVAGVRESVDRYAQPNAAAAVRVVSAALGERAEVTGALALAIARAALAE